MGSTFNMPTEANRYLLFVTVLHAQTTKIRRSEHSRSDRRTFDTSFAALRMALDGTDDRSLLRRIDQPKGTYDGDKDCQKFHSDDDVLSHGVCLS